MLEIVYDKSLGIPSFTVNADDILSDNVNQILENHINLHSKIKQTFNFYLVQNGKRVNINNISHGIIHVIPCLQGGKGGFGSMLRAIGAQIEKTTNKEACRDLSGRRLRDINEEKRLKKWISEQTERKNEAAEKKKRKLIKLCVEPKHEFSDPNYDKARSEMTEKVHDAVEEGFNVKNMLTEPLPFKNVDSDQNCNKDKDKSNNNMKKKIKASSWIDDLGDLSDDDSDGSSEEPKKKIKIG